MKATLKDLMFEAWLRNRETGAIVWETKAGKIIPIKDMTNEHLYNTIKMLKKAKEVKDNFEFVSDDIFYDKD